MASKKRLKIIITEAVLDQLPNRDKDYTVDDYIKLWWYTKFSGDGLRLTPAGDQAFRDAEIEYFDTLLKISIAENSWYSFLAECNKKIKCPYYIGLNKKELGRAEPYIRFYDSKIAMMVNLYGDIKSYLESVKVRT